MDRPARRVPAAGRVALVPLTALFLLGVPLRAPAEASVARPVVRVVLRMTKQFLLARDRIEQLRDLRERLRARFDAAAPRPLPPPRLDPDSTRADFERFVHRAPAGRAAPHPLDHAAPAEAT